MGQKFITGGPSRYAHQRRGLKKMIETKGVCGLLFDPGTGKTATTLDFCSLLAIKAPEQVHGDESVREARVLVIAPLAAIDSWVDQAGKWISPQVSYWAEALGGSLKQRAEALASRGGNPFKAQTVGTREPWTAERALHVRRSLALDFHDRAFGDDGVQRYDKAEGPDGLSPEYPRLVITAINIDSFKSRQRMGSGTMADRMLEAVKRYGPDLVVVDESHRIKSNSSNVSRLMSRIAEQVPRRVILTGTVMPKGPMDVFGQWRFLDPYAFGMPQPDGTKKRASFTHFKDRYAQMGGYMGREVVGYKNLDELESIMAKNSVVARKEDALDLPPTTDSTLTVHFSAKESKAYADMKKDLAVQLDNGEQVVMQNRLAQMMRLRQLTSGFLPDDNGELHTIGTAKADTISAHVHDTLAGEKRIVIFALFTHEIALLRQQIEQKGTVVRVIQGATPSDERIKIRQEFGSDSPDRIVLIAQIKTLSLAVNELVTASHAIFASMSQQRDDYIQARDRLNRIGQKRNVTFWHAMVPGTIDSVVLKSHQEGTDLESAVLKHILES